MRTAEEIRKLIKFNREALAVYEHLEMDTYIELIKKSLADLEAELKEIEDNPEGT